MSILLPSCLSTVARNKEDAVSLSRPTLRRRGSDMRHGALNFRREAWRQIACSLVKDTSVIVEPRQSLLTDVASPLLPLPDPYAVDDLSRKGIMGYDLIHVLRSRMNNMDEKLTRYRAERVRERAARLKRLDESGTATGEMQMKKRVDLFQSYESHWTTRWYCVVSLMMSLEEEATKMTREIIRETNSGFFTQYDAFSRLFQTPFQGPIADEVTYSYVLYLYKGLGICDAGVIVKDVQRKFDIAYPHLPIDVSKTLHLLPQLVYHRGRSLYVSCKAACHYNITANAGYPWEIYIASGNPYVHIFEYAGAFDDAEMNGFQAKALLDIQQVAAEGKSLQEYWVEVQQPILLAAELVRKKIECGAEQTVEQIALSMGVCTVF